MTNLVYIEMSFHFEISNSEWFGGKGSVGYTSQKLGGVSFEKISNLGCESIQKIINETAELMKVDPADVKLISKEQFDIEMDEPEEDCAEDYEDWQEV